MTHGLVLALPSTKAEIGCREVRIVDLFEYAMHTHAYDPIHYHRYPQLPLLGCPFFGDEYPPGWLETVAH